MTNENKFQIGLKSDAIYMQTDTGSTGTGAEWAQILRDIETRGDEVAAHLTEITAAQLALYEAAAAAHARGDKHYAGVSASRGQGSATPHWLTIDDLQTVIDEIEDGEDWSAVEDEDEIADIVEDVKMLVEDIDQAEKVTVLLKVYSGNFVTPSDPREYVIVWAYKA